MLPIGPLMIEHRLIERMIQLLSKESARMEKERTINAPFLDSAADFILVYTDRLHHGKEENFLFAALDKKDLSQEHRRILKELLEEHQAARDAIAEMIAEKERYIAGRLEALDRLVRTARTIADLYPRHVDKEDNHFFLPCMQYFSQAEKDAMLAQEHEFDRNLIHQLYKEKVMREIAEGRQ